MLVVSDTSPVSSLLQIGREQLLCDLFQSVCIPRAVFNELARFHPTLPDFIEVRDVADRDLVAALQDRLDLGEAEAIVLALEARADRLLIDERRGRAVAADRGVPVIGLVGVLLLAHERRLIHSLKQTFADLQVQAGFYLSPELLARALHAAGEEASS